MPASPAATVQEQLASFVECVFKPDDVVEIRRLPSKVSTWHTAGSLADQTTSLTTDNERGENIYLGANPRKQHGGTKTADVAIARCLFADFDGVTPDAAIETWRSAGLPLPTLVSTLVAPADRSHRSRNLDRVAA